MTSIFSGSRASTVVATLCSGLLLAACSETPTRTLAPTKPAFDVLSAPTVLTAQLRTVPGFPDAAWGHLDLFVGMTPTDACSPTPPAIAPAAGTINVAVCGNIHSAGMVYGSGGVWTVPSDVSDFQPQLVAPFLARSQSTDPCSQFDVSGVIQVSSSLAAQLAANPSQFQVLFDGLIPPNPIIPPTPVRIGGLLDGSAWGPIDVAGGGVSIPSDPCRVIIGPAT